MTCIESLECLTCLQKLDLRGNEIENIANIYKLKGSPNLDTLYLQSLEGNHANPCCRDLNYFSVVHDSCRRLIILDGGHVDLRNASQAINIASQDMSYVPSEMRLELNSWIDVESTGLNMKLPDRKGTDKDGAISHIYNLINMIIDKQNAVMLRKMNSAVERMKRTVPA